MPKYVAQCRKYPIPYLYTLSRTIPNLYRLSRIIPYLNTLNRTILCLNTLRKNPNLAQKQIHVGSNQNRARKTLKPRQPIRIEYHSAENTPELSARVEDPSRLAIAYLNTWGSSTPLSDELKLLLLICTT